MKRRCRRFLYVLSLATIAAPGLRAQPLTLVKDLQPGFNNDFSSAAPRVLVAVNGKVLIQAAGASGSLWASDGTAAGTVPIAEIDGALGGYLAQVVAATPLRAFLLQQTFSVEGPRVWRTDATKAGTFVLQNGAGTALAPPNDGRGKFAASGNGLFLAACAAPTECGIWFNSGAAPASMMQAPLDFIDGLTLVALGDQAYWSGGGQVWAVRAGQSAARLVFGAAHGEIRGLAALGGRLYFVAASTAGDEVWVSDGTAAGTRTLTAFPNEDPLPFVSFHATGGRVYFVADDVTHGQELWSTDGTLAGTRRDTDFGFSQAFGTGTVPQALAGRVLFSATGGLNGLQLWVRTGDGAVTALLDPCGPGCSPLLTGDLTVAGGRAFFVAADPNHGYEVWSSDGTRAGTRLLVDACPGSCGSQFSTGASIQALGDRAAFWAGGGLWLSDGRPEGTVKIFGGDGNPNSDLDRTVVRMGGAYFFTGHDELYRREIWISTGTRASSRILTNLLPETSSGSPDHLTALGAGRVIFSSLASGEPQAWISDGTGAGTVPLPGVFPRTCDNTGDCKVFTSLGDIAFFQQRDAGFRTQLWRTDGTVSGALQLTFGDDLGSVANAIFAGELYFLRRGGAGGIELWSSNGTVSGTRLRVGLAGLEYAWGLTTVGNEMYFVGSEEDVYGSNAWRTDGTFSGTRQVSTFASGSHLFSTVPQFVRVGDWVYFVVQAPAFGSSEIWRTTGATASSEMVARPVDTTDLIAFHGALYFFAQISPSSRGLWRADPAIPGITPVAEFAGRSRAEAGQLRLWEDHLYFVAGRAAEGGELWSSDGSSAGTVLVRDIRPGVTGSGITELTAAANGLFFSADDGSHGPELWRSDGTAAGTRLVEDLWPGARGSSPTDFAIANGKLLFAATEDRYGRELWSLDLAAARVCAASETALCLSGGRFRVTADWRDFAGNTGVGHAVALSADTGYFWFFDPANVEVITKVLDGRGVNGHHWVFYGALSSVEYSLTVTDVETGAVRRYFNPRDQFASVGDTQGFGPLGAFARSPTPAGAGATAAAAASSASAPAAACVATATRLCLNGGRFAVQASWKDFAGRTGAGTAVTLTGDTGYFWFFDAGNVEVVLKVLDGRPLNGKFWVFYGALSNVEYTLTVTDTATGAVRTYRNPLGKFGSVGDTSAF